MATFSSFAEFGQAVEKMSDDVEKEARGKIAMVMGERAKSIADSAASADLGGDMKFTHWAPTWETRIKKIPTGVELLPTKSGAGVITVANQGRHQGNASGFSGPGISNKTGKTKKLKSGLVGKVKANKGSRWNGSTKGMHTADKAVAKIEAELPKIAELGVRAVIVRHFDVT